ncbi:MAG: class I SAM-dependent methyltransferase [Chlorobi bacterium]|nr:class I SAM-dependent methyltransferase [Chlorobiota bacterium]
MIDFLQKTKEAFDNTAAGFDEDDFKNPVLQWMRSVVYGIYLDNFRKGNRLLELNSGTGIDAVFLAKNGIKVYATDISPKMLEILEAKIQSNGLKSEIKYAVKSFDEIREIQEDNFDGVISNFGGLNCINDFSKLSKDLYAKLKPGGKIIAAVINKYCLWEIFFYLLKLKPKTAFRRLGKKGIDANLNGGKVRTFYFTPKQFARFFKGGFKTEKIYSHGCFTPPPYLTGFYKGLKLITKILMKIDELTKGLFPFNRLGDHFIIIMNKSH